VNVAALAVELGQLRFGVGAHVPHDLFQPHEVAAGEDRVPVFRDENQVCVQRGDTVPASADIDVIGHETKYFGDVQLRYNYRLYPDSAQREALARAFGCARVVFNDGLRARQDAYAAGLPYITDAELSAALTAAKATPEREWLAGVSAAVLQQALADLNMAYRNFLASVRGSGRAARSGRRGSGPGRTGGRRSGSPPTRGSRCCRAAGYGCRRSET
jgi:putative transposase